MKAARGLLIILAALLGSALFISSATPRTAQSQPSRERFTVYEAATLGTRTPAGLLRAIAIIESGERDHARGPDGSDLGRFQLRDLYRAERITRYGPHDPHNAREAGHVAARILESGYNRFGSWALAATAYHRGAGWTARNGVDSRYTKRLLDALWSMAYSRAGGRDGKEGF